MKPLADNIKLYNSATVAYDLVSSLRDEDLNRAFVLTILKNLETDIDKVTAISHEALVVNEEISSINQRILEVCAKSSRVNQELMQSNEVMHAEKEALLVEKEALLAEKEALLAEKEALLAENNNMQAEAVERNSLIEKLKKENAQKQETINKLQRQIYGSRSDRVVFDLSKEPLLPGFENLLETLLNNQSEADPNEKINVDPHERRKGGHKKGGWNPLPEHLERVEVIIDIPEDEKEDLVFLRYETSERLMYRNAYYVQKILRAVYGESEASQTGLVTAPLPPVPSCFSLDTDRCRYDVSVIAHVISDKLVNHLPFYRQSQMFERLGISFGRSLMCEYFKKTAEALKTLWQSMEKLVMQSSVIHADETSVKMLKPGEGKTKNSWIWTRMSGVAPPLAVFNFELSRSTQIADKILGSYKGIIIRDAFSAYNNLPAQVACCWAHARRYFCEAQDNDHENAIIALAKISLIYKVERKVKNAVKRQDDEDAFFKARAEARKELKPIVEDYFQHCKDIIEKQPPSSSIAKAANYSLKISKELSLFLDDPRVEVDNNACENVIRPLCLGRKNWLFVGNQEAGTNMAILASFAATCKLNEVNFERWLEDVIVKLDTTPSSRINELLPHEWKKITDKQEI